VSVQPALEIAFKNLGGSPLKLQTDEGTEFINDVVQTWLSRVNTHWFHSFQTVKAQICERFNRTLRSKLQKYYAQVESLRYVEVLPKILEGYNNSVHSALKIYTPNQVNDSNTKAVFEIQYRHYLDQKIKKNKFQINDIVRVSFYRSTFFKKTAAYNFKPELFVVTDVLTDTNPPTYRLKAKSDSEAIEGIFYESELQKINLDEC
jgi:hypothetical protein